MYNGKERDKDFGLNWDHYGFRIYDSAIGRFTGVDPIADQFASLSVYNYASNEPVGSIDLHGLQAVKVSEIADYLIGNDDKGIIRTATNEERENSPIRAGLKDGSYVVLNLIGLNIIDDAVATAMDPESTVADVVEAAAPLMSPTKTGGPKGTFGSKKSTTSTTTKEAFGKAKNANGIPKSQQPDKTIKPNTPEGDAAGLDSRNVKQYEFTNSKGEKVSVRQDKPATYNDGGKGDQGKHFNAGATGEKLNQHHNIEKKNN